MKVHQYTKFIYGAILSATSIKGNTMLRIAVLILLSLGWLDCLAKEISWDRLAPGLEYGTVPLSSPGNRGKLHAFRIDLSEYRFDVVLARDHQRAAGSVRSLASKSQAWIAINGGFFTPQLKPLGLRMEQGVIRNTLKKISWWGIFYIQNNKATIVPQWQFKLTRQIDFAVQAGPRLLINHQIPKLKEGLAERTVLGITEDGKVIVAVTDKAVISTHDLAKILKKSNAEGGLNCRNALNLDGGSSSQLFAKFKKFYLNVPNFSPVTDIITIRPRRSEGAV